ncbi:hypothetical protein OAO01_02170 [Oligoflexia bacterium]|nr:hypothetical protein [Oligoflexia bacterium]
MGNDGRTPIGKDQPVTVPTNPSAGAELVEIAVLGKPISFDPGVEYRISRPPSYGGGTVPINMQSMLEKMFARTGAFSEPGEFAVDLVRECRQAAVLPELVDSGVLSVDSPYGEANARSEIQGLNNTATVMLQVVEAAGLTEKVSE